MFLCFVNGSRSIKFYRFIAICFRFRFRFFSYSSFGGKRGSFLQDLSVFKALLYLKESSQCMEGVLSIILFFLNIIIHFLGVGFCSSYFLSFKGVMELEMKELGGKKTVFERIQFEI